MARWRLMEGHYLNVPGTEWEYRETNRDTGRQARKTYEVPLHLDPGNAADWNYPDEIIVSNKFDAAHPRDIVFVGPPTPNMEALDDEAKAISKAESSKWINPIESLNMTYSESRLSEFERGVAQLLAQGIPMMSKLPNMPLGGIDPAAFEKLQEQVATLMERNAQLEEAATKAPKRRL